MKGLSIWFVWKKAVRTIFRNKSKTIPILLLLIFAIGFGTAMYEMQNVRGKAVDEVVESTNFADGFVYFNPLNKTYVDLLINNEIISYFDDYEMRMIFKVDFEFSGEDYEGLLIGRDNSRKSHINSLIDKDKEELDNYKFILNNNFAEENDIERGDKAIISYGSIKKEIKINKVGYNPEFQFIPLYENIAFISAKPYPILYVDNSYLNSIFLNRTTPLVNQLLYQLEKSSDQDDVEELLKLQLGVNLEEVYSQEDHPFIKSMREDEENDRIFILVLTSILVGGAIITLILVIHKLIEDDLKSVSIFQALGANKREILLSYVWLNIILITIALCFGVIFNFILSVPINNFILEIMNIPITIETTITFNTSFLIGLVLFSASLISTIIIVKKTFKMDVIQTLKYETKFLQKRGLMEKLYLKVKKIPNPIALYNLRRIFRRKFHLYSLILSLSFSAALLIFMYSFQDSFIFSIDQKFNYIEKWDCAADTWQYEEEDNMTRILESKSYIDEYEFGIADVALFSKKSNKDFDDTMRILAFEKKSELHQLEVESGCLIKENRDALVSKDILSKFNIEVGANIFLKSIGSDDSDRFIIVGTFNDLITDTIYLSINQAQHFLNKTGKINTIYFTTDDAKEASKKILDLPQIEQVVKINEIKEDANYVLELSSSMFLIFGLLFFFFGLLLITIIFKSIIDYRIEDYSNMKAIGLYNSEVKKNLFFEMLFYFGLSILLGLLIGFVLMKYIIDMYSNLSPGLRFYLYPLSYLYYIVSFSTILTISYFYNYRRIKKINIAEIMRNKTFG